MCCNGTNYTLTCQCAEEDLVLLQLTPPSVEYAHAPFLPAIDLVPPQHRVGVCLDPHIGQCIAVDHIVLNHSKTWGWEGRSYSVLVCLRMRACVCR